MVLSRVLNIVGWKKVSTQHIGHPDLGPGLESGKRGFVRLCVGPSGLKFRSLLHLHCTEITVAWQGGDPRHLLGEYKADHKSVGK